MAAYNGEDWIDSQLDSVLAQRCVKLDLIVGDDASTDGTVGKIQRRRDDRVKVAVNSCASGSAAQNFLHMIRTHTGDGYAYVAFSDQDDIWVETKLIDACNKLVSSGASGYSSPVIAFWSDGSQAILRQNISLTESDFLFEGAGQGCTFVLTIEFYKRLRQFLISAITPTAKLHYHDWAVYALARTWNSRWTFDEHPKVKYRQHANNDTGARSSWHGVFKRLNQIRSGWYRTQLATIAYLCDRAGSDLQVIPRWLFLLKLRPGLRRRYLVARFCLSGGRRRRIDNAILVFAALCGWI